MASISDLPAPTATIFLDIDGVLMWDINNPKVNDKIREKLPQLFEPNMKEDACHRYTNFQRLTAASHFFSEGAVANLHKLIDKVSKVAKVNIVIHSAWREKVSAKDVREQMFAVHAFSKLIVDKTPDPDFARKEDFDKKGVDKLSAACKQKYGFELSSRKGVEIDYWLRENAEKLNIKSFVIFDDYKGDEMPDRFPHNFVHVKKMLSEENIDKAYEILTKPFLPEASKPVVSITDEHKA
jgi:hypothetical protein